MPLTLTVVGGVGTATATIAGSGGGTVTLYSARFGGGLEALAWASAGTRTGDGTIALTPATGHYWFAAEEAGVWTPPVYAIVTTAQALRTRILDAVATRIRALSLTGAAGEIGVYLRRDRRPTTTEQLPCIEVRGGDGPDVDLDLTFGNDRIGYPVLVVFKMRDRVAPDALTVPRADLWYQSIARTFRNQALAGVEEVWQVRIRPLPELDPSKDEYALISGGLLLFADATEPRGFGS